MKKEEEISSKKHLYLTISETIEEQIKNGILKPGDKVPSIRTICSDYNVSMSTAQMAYSILMSKSLIESRPKAGCFVSNWLKNSRDLPQASQLQLNSSGQTDDALVARVYGTMNTKQTTRFSLGAPSIELLPITQLNKSIYQAIKELNGCGTEYENIEGNEKLRNSIARWSYNMGAKLTANDIVTTAGCLNAIAYCLMATTKRGDTIAVESPVFFGLLQLFQSLGLKVIELPTNAQTGIEMDALKKILTTKKINVCLLVSNFSNPLGACMPDEHKKELVKLLSHYHIPLIEDDIYGDLFFGSSRPKTCKSFDEEGMVLWCSSVSKTIAPGYRIGWVAPGKFKEDVVRLKMVHSFTSTTLTQQAVANFLETGKYESYLRKLRHTLHTNSLLYTQAITRYFPTDTRISRPQGGLFLWVELNKDVNTAELFEKALKNKISFVPGKIFSLQDRFHNCMRLGYGLPWSERLDERLKLLGQLI